MPNALVGLSCEIDSVLAPKRDSQQIYKFLFRLLIDNRSGTSGHHCCTVYYCYACTLAKCPGVRQLDLMLYY